MEKQKKVTISPEKKKKLEKADRDFQEMWKRIQPFIKRRKTKEYSTTGKWRTFDYGL